MLTYSDQIQSLPWDNDFAPECQLLFDQNVVPSIVEIEEMTKSSGFAKNLWKQVFGDNRFWETASGLAVSIAAPGVIKSLTEVAAQDISGFLTAGAFAVPATAFGQKLYKAYSEYSDTKKEIERNDLFFYYRAGKLLNS